MKRFAAPRAAATALVVCGGLALAACAPPSRDPGPGHPGPSLIGPVWEVQSVGDRDFGPDSRVTLTFGRDGSAGGQGPCNHYSTGYQRDGNRLTFGQMTSTMMACGDQVMRRERGFFTTLSATTEYEIDESGQLFLYAANGRTIRARRG